MELGLNFDDGDFVGERREKATLFSYNAKICETEWFLDERAIESTDDVATVYKFRADYHYNTRQYDKAIDCFHKCLDTLNSQNKTMRREVVESLARCYLQTADHARALEYLQKMLADCLTSAHFCQALMLQRQIHNHMRQIHEEIQALQQLIQYHSFYYPFWKMLAEAYDRLYLGSQPQPDAKTQAKASTPSFETDKRDIDTNRLDRGDGDCGKETGSCKKSTVANDGGNLECGDIKNCVDEMENAEAKKKSGECTDASVTRQDGQGSCCDMFSEYPRDLVKLTCFVRIKLILNCYMRNCDSFVKERNMERLNRVEQDIQELVVDDSVLETIHEFMRKDMYDDDFEEKPSKEDAGVQNATLPQVLTEDFNKRWFSWIKNL